MLNFYLKKKIIPSPGKSRDPIHFESRISGLGKVRDTALTKYKQVVANLYLLIPEMEIDIT